jgi:membrane dipeptidase
MASSPFFSPPRESWLRPPARRGTVFAAGLLLWMAVVPRAGAAEAPALHAEALVVDLHADTPLQLVLRKGYSLRERLPANQVDVPRMREGNVAGQFFVLYPPAAWVRAGRAEAFCRQALEALRGAAREAGSIVLVSSAAEVRKARAQGKIAGLLGMEGADCLSGKVEALAGWHKEGLRYLGLTWNNSNVFATAAADRKRRERGLTEAGRALVREANRLGVLVDLSHASEQTFWDVYRESRAPIIASHSSAASLRRHLRNLDDEQARAIARTGGVVGVNFHEPFLRHRGRATVDDVARHVAHLVRVAGSQHVALGSDFDGFITAPVGIEDASRLPNLTAALLRQGLGAQDIHRVLGENVLRVLDDAGRDVHGGPRLVPLRVTSVQPRAGRRLFDRNDRTLLRPGQGIRFHLAHRPTHLALVPCARGRVRIELSRGSRLVWQKSVEVGAERLERSLPPLGEGPYRGRISGNACLREVTFYRP